MRKLVNYLLFSVLFSFIFCITIFAEPKVGDVVGNIYSTDIMAYVNDVPINSYNIDGKTVIVLEDLKDYGFDINYDNTTRTLKVIANYKKAKDGIGSDVKRGTVGKITGNIYYTDIVAYVNEVKVDSYNIDGRTVACIEDLGNIKDYSAYEVLKYYLSFHNIEQNALYSKYGMSFEWNPKDLTISLNTLSDKFTPDILYKALVNAYCEYWLTDYCIELEDSAIISSAMGGAMNLNYYLVKVNKNGIANILLFSGDFPNPDIVISENERDLYISRSAFHTSDGPQNETGIFHVDLKTNEVEAIYDDTLSIGLINFNDKKELIAIGEDILLEKELVMFWKPDAIIDKYGVKVGIVKDNKIYDFSDNLIASDFYLYPNIFRLFKGYNLDKIYYTVYCKSCTELDYKYETFSKDLTTAKITKLHKGTIRKLIIDDYGQEFLELSVIDSSTNLRILVDSLGNEIGEVQDGWDDFALYIVIDELGNEIGKITEQDDGIYKLVMYDK